MTVVVEDLDLPNSQTPYAQVDITLAGNDCAPVFGYHSVSHAVIGTLQLKPGNGIDANGIWQADLIPNSLITPAGTSYRIVRRASDGSKWISCVEVPVVTGGAAIPVSELPQDTPEGIDPTALGLHATQPLSGATHGELRHSWDTDGWGAFTPIVMTAHAPQAFTLTVDSRGRGVATGNASTNGNLRMVHARQDTRWRDSEITSTVWGPLGSWAGNNAQQWHLHRVREVSPGLWEAIAVWTSVIADYSWLHCKAVRWDGITLWQSGGGEVGGGPFAQADIDYIDHATPVLAHQRFTFFSWIHEYRLRDPLRAAHLAIGDVVSTTLMANATFNKTNIALNDIARAAGVTQLIDDTTTGAVAWTTDAVGTFAPSGVHLQKRYCPFQLATRVVGGTASSVTVLGKRWRYNEPEPDWSDVRVQRAAVTPNAGVLSIATEEGECAIGNAHLYSSSALAWGDVRFRKL